MSKCCSALFCSYMVLRKDVREINIDSTPKADASLKPGEFTEVYKNSIWQSLSTKCTSSSLTSVGWSVCCWHTRQKIFRVGFVAKQKEKFCFVLCNCSGGELLSHLSLFLCEVLTRPFFFLIPCPSFFAAEFSLSIITGCKGVEFSVVGTHRWLAHNCDIILVTEA